MRTILAPIVESFLPGWPELDERERAVVTRAALEHVNTTLAAAPLHIRLGMMVLAITFRAYAALLGAGRGYGARGRVWRAAFVRRWSALGAAPRSFVRLMRSLTVLSVWEHSLTKRKLGLPGDIDHQMLMRDRRAALLSESGPL